MVSLFFLAFASTYIAVVCGSTDEWLIDDEG